MPKPYKEKRFTKGQLSKIESARRAIDWLMNHGVEVHGRQDSLVFMRTENVEAAETSGRWATANFGELITCERIDITDSGADDQFQYPEYMKVIKE
jgi:hypothetical protein